MLLSVNVAITRARAALHVVGDLRACLTAGGALGKFATACISGERPQRPAYMIESEQRMAELLSEAGLWHKSAHKLGKYDLDFLVVSPLGTRYDLEVDGPEHLDHTSICADAVRDSAITAAGLKVQRVDTLRLFQRPDEVRTLLQRLV
ncbi:MAG: hypothetical protein ACRETA_11185 [Gammaproteobacteria bacterium]